MTCQSNNPKTHTHTSTNDKTYNFPIGRHTAITQSISIATVCCVSAGTAVAVHVCSSACTCPAVARLVLHTPISGQRQGAKALPDHMQAHHAHDMPSAADLASVGVCASPVCGCSACPVCGITLWLYAVGPRLRPMAAVQALCCAPPSVRSNGA